MTVNESGRMLIDLPSLDAWLRRRIQSDSVPGGGRWTDSGTRMGKNDATTAMFTRTFVWRGGVTGVVQYGAATGNGREGRVFRATFGTRAAMDGPRGQVSRTLFMERMLAEVTAGLSSAASPAPTPPARSPEPAPRAPAPAPPASAANAPAASVAPAGWRESQDPLTPGGRLFVEVGSPLAAMIQVRESRRTLIDAPSLEAWVTRIARADAPPAGTQWGESGEVIGKPNAENAMFVRGFTVAGRPFGAVMFGAASGDGKQGRIIRALLPTPEANGGPRNDFTRKFFVELMLSEIKAGNTARPVPAAPTRVVPVPTAPAPAGAAAQVAPAAWRSSEDPLNPGGSLYVEVGEPLAAMWQIRESPRINIDAPSLGEWLTRLALADTPPVGMQWYGAGQMIEAPTEETALFSRVIVAPDGGRGLVVYAAATGDGKQGRMIRVMHPTRESLEGRRGVTASEVRSAMQLAERAAGRARLRAPSSPPKFTNPPK